MLPRRGGSGLSFVCRCLTSLSLGARGVKLHTYRDVLPWDLHSVNLELRLEGGTGYLWKGRHGKPSLAMATSGALIRQ